MTTTKPNQKPIITTTTATLEDTIERAAKEKVCRANQADVKLVEIKLGFREFRFCACV